MKIILYSGCQGFKKKKNHYKEVSTNNKVSSAYWPLCYKISVRTPFICQHEWVTGKVT